MALNSVFIDSDVLIDMFAAREPFFTASSQVIALAYDGRIKLRVSSLTYSNLFYILRKFGNRNTALEKLRVLNALAITVDIGEREVKLALNSGFTDFEDALQYYGALSVKCDCLVTRNIDDYKLSEIPVFTPIEFIQSKNWE